MAGQTAASNVQLPLKLPSLGKVYCARCTAKPHQLDSGARCHGRIRTFQFDRFEDGGAVAVITCGERVRGTIRQDSISAFTPNSHNNPHSAHWCLGTFKPDNCSCEFTLAIMRNMFLPVLAPKMTKGVHVAATTISCLDSILRQVRRQWLRGPMPPCH
jgi:hypothetical protein